MTTMKKLLTIFLAVLLMLCMSVSLGGCQNDKDRIIHYIYKVTGISISENTKLLYEHEEKYPNFFPVPGREDEYYVFEFESQPTDSWLEENGFSDKKDPDYEHGFFYGGFGLMDLSMAEEIPKEYLPDFEKEYCWVVVDLIYFAYFPENLRLIICVVPH